MTREWVAPMTQAGADALVRDYTEQQLRANYERAARQPGTLWHLTLLAEMNRRGLNPEGGAA